MGDGQMLDSKIPLFHAHCNTLSTTLKDTKKAEQSPAFERKISEVYRGNGSVYLV